MKKSVKLWLLTIALLLAPAAIAQKPDYAALGKNFVALLTERQFDKAAAQFDERMKAALPAEKLASVWDSLIAKAGAFKSVNGARVSEQSGYHVVVVSCVFEQAAIDVQVAFDAQSKIGGLYFRPGAAPATESSWSPPAYVDPSKFHEQAVTVADGKWRLPGSLALPNGKGTYPALVLVQGSGPHDEDETIGPNKPFKDLAQGLASRGIAVLRYVKRTKEYPAESAANPKFTVNDETVDDAVAAVALLASRPDIDAKRVFVLGHSLGGTLAPRIAQRSGKVAGLVLLAAGARPLEDVVVEQLEYLASLQPSPEMDSRIAEAQRSAAQVKSTSLKADDMVDLLGAKVPASYFLDLRTYNPTSVASSLGIPILVFQGSHDYQVTRSDYDLWLKAQRSGGSLLMSHFYPDLTHLFIPARPGKPSPADYEIAGHVSPDVVDDIAMWILHSSR